MAVAAHHAADQIRAFRDDGKPGQEPAVPDSPLRQQNRRKARQDGTSTTYYAYKNESRTRAKTKYHVLRIAKELRTRAKTKDRTLSITTLERAFIWRVTKVARSVLHKLNRTYPDPGKQPCSPPGRALGLEVLRTFFTCRMS